MPLQKPASRNDRIEGKSAQSGLADITVAIGGIADMGRNPD